MQPKKKTKYVVIIIRLSMRSHVFSRERNADCPDFSWKKKSAYHPRART